MEPIFIQDRILSLDLETGSTNKHTNTHIYMLASEWIVANLKQNEAQALVQNQNKKELISAWNTEHKFNFTSLITLDVLQECTSFSEIIIPLVL